MLEAERTIGVLRVVLVAIATLGTAVFALGFVATYVARPQIERAAARYLRAEVEDRARAELDKVKSLARATPGGTLLAAVQRRMTSVEAFSKSNLPEVIAHALAQLCDIECEEEKDRRAKASTGVVRAVAGALLADLGARREGLVAFIQGFYRQRLHELIEDLRLFTGVNASLFAVCLGLLGLKRQHMRLVLLPIALLTLATVGSTVVYFFGQDWFWTIVTGDFMGAWYLLVVALVFSFCLDIVVLKGRLTQGILEALPFVPDGL